MTIVPDVGSHSKVVEGGLVHVHEEERRGVLRGEVELARIPRLETWEQRRKVRGERDICTTARDLVHDCTDAGFFPVRLRLKAELTPHEPRPWQTFLNVAWNPKVPTLAEAVEQVLSPSERELLTRELRPQVETGTGVSRLAHAWLSATKPAG